MAVAWSTGRIVKFDQERGYGFISPDGGDEDLFVHTNDLFFEKALARPGVEVKFRFDESDRGPKASDVELASAVRGGESPRRGSNRFNREDLVVEITDLLLDAAPDLTGAQILTIRRRVADFAVEQGLVDP